MLQVISAYSAPSTTNILNGNTIQDVDIKNLVESSNGVNARLADITNNVQRELTVANNGISLTANQDVNIFANATGGAFGVILPDRATQKKPLFFKKHKDTTYNGFTVTCAGSDKIQDLTSPLSTFTATSFTIKSPDQYFTLIPTTAGWEFGEYSNPVVEVQASLSTAGVNATNTESKLYYNSETVDIGGYYNNATSGTGGRFTPLIKGKYNIEAFAYFNAGTSSELILLIYRNTSPIAQISFTDTGNAVIRTGKNNVSMNGTTDYLEVFVRSATATKGVLNLSYVTFLEIEFSKYY